MDKKLYDRLKKDGKLKMLKCETGCHIIECICGNRMLRPWHTKKGQIALCYECGCLFFTEDEKVISKYNGDPSSWTVKAFTDVKKVIDHVEPYMGKSLEARKKEYLKFIRTMDGIPEEIKDEEVLDFYQFCTGCNKGTYTDKQFDWSIIEFGSPEKTHNVLLEFGVDHVFNDYVSEEFDPVLIDDETYKSEKFPIFMSLEIRDYLLNYISTQYCRWVMNGELFILVHDNDPPWDCSGELINPQTSKVERLMEYDSVGDWMGKTYTGEIFKTRVSGKGLDYESIQQDVEGCLLIEMFSLWTKKLSEEDGFDLLENSDFQDAWNVEAKKVMGIAKEMSIIEAWQRGYKQARIELDNETLSEE